MFEPRILPCPECGRRMTVRTSRQVTEMMRELYVSCDGAHGELDLKALAYVVGDLHQGSYDDGLHLPQSLRKQALAPVPRPHRDQLVLPTVEPVPPRPSLGHNEYPCPCCGKPMRFVRAEQQDPLTRDMFAVCFTPECPGKFKVRFEYVSVIAGPVGLLPALPRFARRQALACITAPDPRQADLPGLDPPTSPPGLVMT